MALIAILDANVLWPQALRDTLIRAAIWELYRPAWTLQILEETARSLVREGRVERQRIDRTVRLMRENCPHFLVEGYEELIPEMRNDEKDRHVLAAAVRAQASTIVTSNVRHFPAAARDPYGIGLHTPDEFLSELWDLSPDTMAKVLVQQARTLHKPPKSVFELLDELARSGPAPTFAQEARDWPPLRTMWESDKDLWRSPFRPV